MLQAGFKWPLHELNQRGCFALGNGKCKLTFGLFGKFIQTVLKTPMNRFLFTGAADMSYLIKILDFKNLRFLIEIFVVAIPL